jgi:flagellar motility protein MotE (MotC chaperone)
MADKDDAKTDAAAGVAAAADAKAGEAKAKKKLKLPAIPKLPLDMILLVAVPFIAFVVIFLYVMGYVPAKPVVLNVSVVSPAPQVEPEEAGAGEEAAGEAEAAADSSEAAAPEAATAVAPRRIAAGAAAKAAPVAKDGGLTSQAPSDTSFSIERLARELGAAQAPAADLKSDAEAEAAKTKKIKQMAKVYEQMTATSVAAIVDNLPQDEAVKILSVMTPRSAAKVLAALGPEKAADMSLMLTGFAR